ncbi:MAG: hypothetical protein JWM20_935 [Patescibacteria group bacterium]|nr:hypothetical protein [Patescibacteria group bacterium]
MNTKPTIAFDFDDVLCDTVRAFLEFREATFGPTIAYDDLSEKPLHEDLGISEDEESKRWDLFFKNDEFCYPKPDVEKISTLENLKPHARLVILTARYRLWHAQILTFVERYVPTLFEEVIFTDHREGKKLKGVICKEQGISLLVDDNPEQIASCEQNGIEVLVFNQPWNRHLQNVRRITSFAELC